MKLKNHGHLVRRLLMFCMFVLKSQLQTDACLYISNPNDSLKFQSNMLSSPYTNQSYPLASTRVFIHRTVRFHCCATGFTEIIWYINGTVVSENSHWEFSEKKQVLTWSEVEPQGKSNLTCQLIKRTELKPMQSLVHTIAVTVDDDSVDCKMAVPRYSLITKNKCAVPGDNVTIECLLTYEGNECILPFFQRAFIYKGYEHSVVDESNVKLHSERRENQQIMVTAAFYNITQEQLSSFYRCFAAMYEYRAVNITFNQQPSCETPLTKKEIVYSHRLLIKLGIPLMIISMLIVIAIVCGYKHRTTLRVFWRTYLKPTFKGDKSYDLFILSPSHQTDVSFVNDRLLQPLEKFYQVCWPIRDADAGTVIPEQITDQIKMSKRLLAVVSSNTSSDMWFHLAVTIAAANHVPIIFIVRNITPNQMESLYSDSIYQQIVKASTVISYPQEDITPDGLLDKFYNQHLLPSLPLIRDKSLNSEVISLKV